jgi:thiopurine S-methyltransferase
MVPMHVEIEAWNARWREGRIGFHQGAVNPELQAQWATIVTDPAARVLVPLCGKSVDMLWLHQRGHSVVGVELSTLAAAAFFEENQLDVERLEVDGFEVYKGCGDALGIEIWCGDFFRLSVDQLGPLQGWYDRAAIVALPPNLWGSYALKIAELLDGEAAALMLTFKYNQMEREGPPFSVSFKDVGAHFGGTFDVVLLETLDLSCRNRWGLSWVHEPVMRLNRSR